MIRHILLVAAREFRQITGTRSFWLTLLILPLAFAVGPLSARLSGPPRPAALMVIDPVGHIDAAMRAQVATDETRAGMIALSRYVQRHHLEAADPAAAWARHASWFDDAEVARFAAAGGVPAAAAVVARSAPAGSPAFRPPEPGLEVVAPAPGLAAAAPAARAALIERTLHPADHERAATDFILDVPGTADPAGAPARLWTAQAPDSGVVAMVQKVLARDVRARFLQAHGVDAPAAAQVETLAAPLAVVAPPPGAGRDRIVVRSILPLVTAYVLLMSLLLSGSWMLQGLIEERSNKLLEAVLACVSPDALMYGKLLGIVSVGLTMVAAWFGCGIAVGLATHGAIADFIRPALAPLSSPGVILAMIYFFIAGYVIIAMIFLAIGAVSDSFRDAQSYLTPVMLAIALPFGMLTQAILRDTHSIVITVMTWVPIYTPFAILARMGGGVPATELWGAGAMLAVFIALELVLLGRVFRASLLSSGQRLRFGRARA